MKYTKDNLDILFNLPPKEASIKLGLSIKQVLQKREYVRKNKPEIYKQYAITKYEYKSEELDYLNKVIPDFHEKAVRVIKEYLPEKVCEMYLTMLGKTIKDEKLFSRAGFFVDLEPRVLDLLLSIVLKNPLPVKILVEKQVRVKEVDKKVPINGNNGNNKSIHDTIYTCFKVYKDFDDLFDSEKTVYNFATNHQFELRDNFMEVNGTYIFTETGVLILTDLYEKTLADTANILPKK